MNYVKQSRVIVMGVGIESLTVKLSMDPAIVDHIILAVTCKVTVDTDNGCNGAGLLLCQLRGALLD